MDILIPETSCTREVYLAIIRNNEGLLSFRFCVMDSEGFILLRMYNRETGVIRFDKASRNQ